MNYRLQIGERVHEVECAGITEGSFQAIIDGRTIDVSWQRISGNHLHLAFDGSCVNVYIAGSGESRNIMIGGASFSVRDADADARNPRKKQSLRDMPLTVTPPMPSVVVRILVREGDMVEKGQAVVVVSAMKMETTLRSPHDGKVSAIRVAEGDKVMPGDILVDIEDHETAQCAGR